MSEVANNIHNAESFLLGKRVVSLSGGITREQSDQIIGQLIALQIASKDPITLLINSGGGANRPALLLYEVIKHFIHCEVNAVVCGQCSSAATFVLLACKKRSCTPYSTFVVHSSRMSGMSFDTNANLEKDLADVSSEVKKLREFLVEFYVKNLGLSDAEVIKLIHQGDQRFDSELSAQEAVKLGIVQEIVSDKLPFFAA